MAHHGTEVARLNIKRFNMNELQLNSKTAIIGKPGCFEAGTKVLMYDGTIKSVENVKQFEQVMGDDWTPRSVLELARGWEMMHKITIHASGKAHHVTVNSKHKLVLIDARENIIEIKVEDFLEKGEDYQRQWRWFRCEKKPVTVKDGIKIQKLIRTTYNFEITTLKEDHYYGFTLDGNHRFLLGDFSVVRNTGKSTLMKDIMFNHRNEFPIGLVMSETNKDSGDFKGLVPELFTHDAYNQEAIDNLVIRQKRMVRKNGERHPDNFAFIILDDCTDDTSWVNHTTTKGIFKNGRHWDLFFVLAMQYCLDIPPSLRTSLDYVFILREPNFRNRKQLWENYASIFPTFNMFCDALDDLTQDYHCMVIKNRVLSNKIEDVVFWYKAARHKPFKVGTDSWWRWAERNYNARYELEEEERQLANRQQQNILQRGGRTNVKFKVRMYQ
jgi:hypothetical protein